MKIKTILATVALVAVPFCAFAQSNLSNEELSKNLDNQISAINADIKALKAHMKAEPNNTEYSAQLNQKNEALKTAKDRKKVIDEAIKAEKKSETAAKNAEAAQKKYEKAHKAADNVRERGGFDKSKSNEQISDELDTQIELTSKDIKNLKEHKKLEPNNASTYEAQIKQKQDELKEMKRKKKIIDTELKTSKTAEKKADKAEQAQKNHDKAKDKADDLRKDME